MLLRLAIPWEGTFLDTFHVTPPKTSSTPCSIRRVLTPRSIFQTLALTEYAVYCTEGRIFKGLAVSRAHYHSASRNGPGRTTTTFFPPPGARWKRGVRCRHSLRLLHHPHVQPFASRPVDCKLDSLSNYLSLYLPAVRRPPQEPAGTPASIVPTRLAFQEHTTWSSSADRIKT